MVQELLATSYARAKREVEAGRVTVDGVVTPDPGAWVGEDAEVRHEPGRTRLQRAPAAPPLPVLYMDAAVMVVVKPAGLLVHPISGGGEDTVVGRALAEATRRSGARERVLVVHRLDRDTSGVMVLARSHEAAQRLQGQFRAHTVSRRYLALVAGDVAVPETVERPIGRPRPGARRRALRPGQGGQSARTAISPVERFGRVTLVEAELGTGRQHQVRVHLASLHHPVLGDTVYGSPGDDPVEAPRLALHAAHLGFVNPGDGRRLEFDEPLPEDLRRLVRRLRQRSAAAAVSGPPAAAAGSAAASRPPRRRRRRPPGGR